MAVGVVREWRDEEGWGVLESEETPGGCWAHFSALSMAGYRTAAPGERVTFTYQRSPQDGFDYLALGVTIDGVPKEEPASQPPRTGSFSRLTVDTD